jgi:hypothetical protein
VSQGARQSAIKHAALKAAQLQSSLLQVAEASKAQGLTQEAVVNRCMRVKAKQAKGPSELAYRVDRLLPPPHAHQQLHLQVHTVDFDESQRTIPHTHTATCCVLLRFAVALATRGCCCMRCCSGREGVCKRFVLHLMLLD